MTRFFFDIVHNTSLIYDFHGKYFKTVTEAHEMAEYVSLDLACSEKDAIVGYQILVRDAAGSELFSIPVRTPESGFA